MKRTTGTSLFAMSLLGASLLVVPAVQAQSTYFAARCASCHNAAGVIATCNGCHHHGNSSLAASTNKSSYAPGETVTATLTGGSKSGWIRAVLYDQTGAQIAISSGNASGMGSSTTFPATLTAPAPAAPGSYTWKMAYFGNADGTGHSEITKNISFTVAALSTVDTTPPTLTVSTLADNSYSNTVTLNVSGVATDAGGLSSVTVNGATVKINADGSFSTAVTLSPGANTITIIATDVAGNKNTVTRTITYDATAPVLAIAAPADNSTSATSSITVSGTVSESSTVTVSVNGGSAQSAVVNGGTFTIPVILVAGINTIDVNATDQAGNSSSAKRTVTYTAAVSQLSLAVTTPAQDVTTSNKSMTVKGKVAGASGKVQVKVSVNNSSSTVRVNADGSFSQKVNFSRAQLYIIKVSARDAAGNSAGVTRNVIYRNLVEDDNNDDD